MRNKIHRICIVVPLALCIGVYVAATVHGDDVAARKVIDKATTQLANFDFTNAYIEFTSALNLIEPSDPLWIRAAYGKAVAAQHRTPPTKALIDEAGELFKSIASKNEHAAFAAQATINLGRIAELRDYPGDEVNLPAARKYYAEAIERWPNSKHADEAALWQAGTFIQVSADLGSVRRGVVMLEQWLQRRPENAYASAMQLYLADTYFQTLKDRSRAIDCYVRADALGLPVRAEAGIIYWRLATIAEQAKQIDIAIEYYQKIVRITPTSGRAYESQQALGRIAAAYPDRNIKIPTIELYQSDAGNP